MAFGELGVDSVGVDSPSQGVPVYAHSASIGPMLGNNTSVIDSITLHHVYMGGQRVNRYTFHRPRVLNMTLDQMDMTNGDTTELRMEFAYDGIEIVNNDPVAMVAGSDGRLDQRPGIRYPLGGAGSTAESPSNQAPATQAPSGLAELYADGRAYVEGFVSGATKMAGDAIESVTTSARDLFNSIT